MRIKIPLVALATVGSAIVSTAQEPVLLAGGSTPPTPVMATLGLPAAYPAPAMPLVPRACPRAMVHAACPGQLACLQADQVVSGGYYNAPNVVYFGGPNSCYYNSYPGDCYRPGCVDCSSSVIYFGRGEAWERGYAFRHYR